MYDEIRALNEDAARVLSRAGFCTDSEIQSLTRIDLNELFPGPEKLKLRRKIFEIIQKQKPIDLLLKDMNEYIPKECLHTALMNDGVLATYLHILQDIRTQVNNVHTSLDAHFILLENLNKNLSDLKPNRGSLSGTSTSAATGPTEPHRGRNSSYFPGMSGFLGGFLKPSHRITPHKKVTCKTVVSGMTFNAHLQLLDKVKPMDQDWDLVCVDQEESPRNQNYQIIIVFRPISSRIGTDVEAAMHEVEGNKPIILVLMHHVHEARYTSSLRTWDNYPHVVLQVDVFFHETARGLLDCQQNVQAASVIQNKLGEYKTMTS